MTIFQEDCTSISIPNAIYLSQGLGFPGDVLHWTLDHFSERLETFKYFLPNKRFNSVIHFHGCLSSTEMQIDAWTN